MEKLNYKKKCLVLLGAFMLFLVLGYRFSFSDTFTVMSQMEEKEQKLGWLKEKEKELPALRSKMAEFEKAYSRSDSGSVRDKLTAFISGFAEDNNCLVTEIPRHSSFNNDKLNVQTNSFTVKGSFFNLLALLHKLENEHKYVSKIMSARFFSVKDLQSKKKNLYLTMITQSFEQK